jgi:hypothetical protein
MNWGTRSRLLVATALSLVLAAPGFISPQEARADTEERVKRLEQVILEQQRKLAEQEKRLKELETRRPPDPEIVRGGVRRTAPRVITLPPGSASQPVEPSPQQPFVDGVKHMFHALSDEGLADQRGGAVPVYRVELPGGATVLVPAAMIQTFLAQQPRDPGFEVEPEQPRQQPAPRRPPPRVVPRRAAPPPAPPAPPVARPAPQPPPAAPPATDETERARAQKSQDAALLERGAILLPRGTLQLEPGIEYSKFSGNNVQISGVSIFDAIIIGFIRVDANDRDLLTGTLRARYGVINRVQIDATLPYIYRRDHEVLGIGTPDVRDRSFTGNGIGDVEFGVSGQPVIGRGWVPNILVRVFTRIPTGKSSFQIPTVAVGPGGERRLTASPTGSGFYAVGGTVTAVLPIDPVVLFAGGGYTMNFPRTWGVFGRIDPGDTWEFFAGLNFALNERVSFNFSFIQQRSLPTQRDGTRLVNTSATDARAIFGTSVGLSRNVNLVMNAGVGLTPASPNFTFFVSLPITFQLFE